MICTGPTSHTLELFHGEAVVVSATFTEAKSQVDAYIGDCTICEEYSAGCV